MRAAWAKRLLLAIGLATGVVPGAGHAFTITGLNLLDAQRWALDYGLADGIQVGIDPAIAGVLGATTPQEEARVLATIEAAFRAWESPTLSFDLQLDSSVTIGTSTGFEIDLLALPGNHLVFIGQQVFALAGWSAQPNLDRTLSNGMRATGEVILGADIYLNTWMLSQLAPALPDEATRLAALQRLLMHEIGHTLGLAHPDALANWDTDLDPTNAIALDPADPFASLFLSPNLPTDAVMSVRPCGAELINCAPLFYTSLTNDELGGRDALYPVAAPEGSVTGFLALGGLALAAARALRATRA